MNLPGSEGFVRRQDAMTAAEGPVWPHPRINTMSMARWLVVVFATALLFARADAGCADHKDDPSACTEAGCNYCSCACSTSKVHHITLCCPSLSGSPLALTERLNALTSPSPPTPPLSFSVFISPSLSLPIYCISLSGFTFLRILQVLSKDLLQPPISPSF